jgi:hypothetical protein
MTAEPPTNGPTSTPPDTASARGIVRDALGGFRNLLGLLRSIRVGPQAAGAVIPDVRAACNPMIRALHALLERLPEEAASCREALAAFLLPPAAALDQALGKVGRGPLRARDRLHLERALTRYVPDIEIGYRLLSLLHATRHARSVSIDVAELITQEETLVLASPPATRIVRLSVPSEGAPVVVDPRLAAAILAVAAGMVARQAETEALSLGITIADERCTLRLEGSQLEPRRGVTMLTVLEPVAPTEVCLRAAAMACGCSVTVSERHVELVIPMGSAA